MLGPSKCDMERQGGGQGLCAPVARDFRPRLLHTRKGCEGTVFRQAAGSLSREMGGMRALCQARKLARAVPNMSNMSAIGAALVSEDRSRWAGSREK